jgi:CheY-like chemotaxis protein/tetratricopeptide (TPR) repeat protein
MVRPSPFPILIILRQGIPMNEVQQVLKRLKQILELPELLELWKRRSTEVWSADAEIYRQLGERILKKGSPFVALDVLAEGLKLRPADLRLRQLQALALATSGATARANAILRQLYEEGHTDGDTLGILARTYKDFSARATSPAERKAQMRQAHALYLKAYRLAVGRRALDDAIYTGINAASTALLLGQKTRARDVAGETRVLCLKKLKKEDTYWTEASLGEAALLMGEWEEAERRYGRAGEMGRGNFRDLSATRRQARLLLLHLGREANYLDHCFGIGRVVVFAGHMIDQPGRPCPRFPAQLEKPVSAAIEQRLQKLDAGFGYSSAACGADILFLEAMLARRRGAEVHVVLPFPPSEYRKTTVDIIPGADWGIRFEKVLKQASDVRMAAEQKLEEGSVPYEYANILLHGLAGAHAAQLDAELAPLAVWDGQPGDGPGGTASIVARWRALGLKLEPIDLADILRRECPELAAAGAERAAGPAAGGPGRPAELAHPAPGGRTAPSEPEQPSSTAEPAERIKILAVDDDPSVRNLLCEALAQLPIPAEVFAAANGREALEKVMQVHPNLVLLDVAMPEVNGIDVCRWMRRDWRTAFIPVIMLPGNRNEESRAKECLLGTDDYINKSQKAFTAAELSARVGRVLRRVYGI